MYTLKDGKIVRQSSYKSKIKDVCVLLTAAASISVLYIVFGALSQNEASEQKVEKEHHMYRETKTDYYPRRAKDRKFPTRLCVLQQQKKDKKVRNKGDFGP